MADEKSIREALAAAMAASTSAHHKMAYSITNVHSIDPRDCCAVICVDSRAALDRHKREPEEPCAGGSDCSCYKRGVNAERRGRRGAHILGGTP